jgi:hypothetical protein
LRPSRVAEGRREGPGWRWRRSGARETQAATTGEWDDSFEEASVGQSTRGCMRGREREREGKFRRLPHPAAAFLRRTHGQRRAAASAAW